MTGEQDERWQSWIRAVPSTITGDVLWSIRAYRLALFVSDLAWEDVTRLRRDYRTNSLGNQLYRSVCSIGANVVEGYSRSTGKERARFVEIALGSAREARDWYYRARHVLSETTVDDRLMLLTEIVRLLLTMIADQRQGGIREEPALYGEDSATE